MNRYFIINLPISFELILELEPIIVGTWGDQRKNNDNTKMVIKLFVGDEEDYPALGQSYTHSEILTELQNLEWN